MTFDDLLKIYQKKQKEYGSQAYRYISSVLQEAEAQHKKEFTGTDQGQSWRAFKGKNLEKLIQYIIEDEVRNLNLEIVNGNTLNGNNLPKMLSRVKRNLLIDYGEFGCHLPDADIIIYNPKTSEVIAILSSKVTLRERIAQTGYWKLKLAADEVTKHIKVYFVTLDEDGTLTVKTPTKKGRAIAETDIDGSYVLSEVDIEESDMVKMFDRLIDDLKSLLKETNPNYS